MNRHSIFVFVTLLFLLALTGTAALFGLLYVKEKRQAQEREFRRYLPTIHLMRDALERFGSRAELEERLERLKMRDATKEAVAVMKKGRVVRRRPLPEGEVAVIDMEGRRFLLVRSRDQPFLLEDLRPQEEVGHIVAGFAAMALLVVAGYVVLLRKLLPLRTLREQIRRYGEGERGISTATDRKDEVGELANEFHRAMAKLEAMDESRSFFLRNVMHELKTPITKGRVALGLLEPSRNRERLAAVFLRMDALINEMARIEGLSSGTVTPVIRNYRIVDLLAHARDMLADDGEKVELEGCEGKVDADFELLAIALKNLMENGCKYATDGRARVACDPEGVTVSSAGGLLEKPLEFYTKPFNRDNTAGIGGLGLGLYVVERIAGLHGFALEYRHEEGVNLFRVDWAGRG